MHLRPRLPLRTKVSVFFGLLALVTAVTLSVVTYSYARTFMLRERATEAQQQAIENARTTRRLLISNTPDFGEEFQIKVPARDDGFNLVIRPGSRPSASDVRAPEAFPDRLRGAVEDGTAGIQRFRFDGVLYLGVGIPILEVDAEYYESFPLGDTERALRVLLFSLTIGTVVITVLAATVGVWTSRRLLRPLERLTSAAGDIAAGDLDARLSPERDPDLAAFVDSFNGMADAVQARVEREARFASDVSHELRSPITALSAATDVLEGRREELPERARQAVDVIIGQVRRFDGMVIDLLELSRLDAGAPDLHVESVDLADLCRRVANHNGFAGVPIEIDPAAPTQAVVDRVRFERILGNLLTNAQHHGGGAVRVSIERGEAGYVLVAVEDAGPGVDPSERAHIFERFARGNAGRHRVGTGLGLALVAENAAALGGWARVEDRPDGGARFVVCLRSEPSAAEQDGAE